MSSTDIKSNLSATAAAAAAAAAAMAKLNAKGSVLPSSTTTSTSLSDADAESARERAMAIAARMSGGVPGSTLGKRRLESDNDGHDEPRIRRRINFPNQDNDMNMIGIILGPKGSNLKSMENEFGCKIYIRGQGAQRAGGNQSSSHHDDEETHVLILGSNEDSVSRAYDEISRLMNDPEYAMKKKRQQLSALSDDKDKFNSGSSYSHSGSGSSGPGGDYTETFEVPTGLVGSIIGKGGESIRVIMSRNNVQIQIQTESEMAPGSSDRSITVTGSRHGVEQAKRSIFQIVQERQQMFSQNPSNSSSSSSQPRSNYGYANPSGGVNPLSADIVKRIPVPDDKVGSIIGRKGETIRQIKQNTGAYIHIPPECEPDRPQFRMISISGNTEEQVEAAEREIYSILQNEIENQSNQVTIQVPVPDRDVGLIIGAKGATVKELQMKGNCKINIPRDPDPLSDPPMRMLEVVGPAHGCEYVKSEIASLLSNGPKPRGRNDGGRGNAYNQRGGPAAQSSGGSRYGMNSSYGGHQDRQQDSYGSSYGNYYAQNASANPYAAAQGSSGQAAAAPYDAYSMQYAISGYGSYPYGQGYYGATGAAATDGAVAAGSATTASSIAATAAAVTEDVIKSLPPEWVNYRDDLMKFYQQYGYTGEQLTQTVNAALATAMTSSSGDQNASASAVASAPASAPADAPAPATAEEGPNEA